MGIRSQLLSCLVIFAAVACGELPKKTSVIPVGLNEYMMGRYLPIWIARYFKTFEGVVYTRINGLPEFLNGHGLAPPPEASVQESAIKNKNVSGTENATVVEDKVIYPSVLLVMDYHTVTPLADPKSKWHPGQLFVYASAFWHSVNTAMKHLQNPRVSIQIAGILMTDSRNNTPYLFRDEGAETFSKALPAMMNHWRNLINTTGFEFPRGAFDIVVHMTDVKTLNGSSAIDGSEHDSEFVATTEGSPCELEDQIAGIIIGDGMKFEGVSRAAEAMTKVLRPSKAPGSDSSAVNKLQHDLKEPIVGAVINVGEMIMESVSPSIPVKNVLCMSAPKTIYPRGEALVPVYAPYLDKKWPECQIPGYYNDPKVLRCDDTDIFAQGSLAVTKSYLDMIWAIMCSYNGPAVVKGCTLQNQTHSSSTFAP